MDRRTVLRGAGALIALPWLEAMMPRRAKAQSTFPMRLGVFCFPFGTLRAWSPSTFGSGYTMPSNLAAITPFRDRVVVTSGLGAHGLPQGSHMASVPYFTTEPLPNCTFRVRSKSADVMIAEHFRRTNPSLHHLVTAPRSAFGFKGCYPHGGQSWEAGIGTYLSWSDETTPTSQIRTPQAVFDRLFAGIGPGPNSDAWLAYRKARGNSVLDAVLEQAKSLVSRVGGSDRKKLDQYFTNLREVERTLNAQRAPVAQGCSPGERPAASMPFDQETKAFLDLAVLAMACDRSRVVTHLMDSEAEIHRGFPWLGISGSVGHHLYSHYNNNEGGVPASSKPAVYLKITAWYAEQLAYLLKKMTSYKEGAHDLLYNSVIVFGSGMGPDGAAHDQRDIPLVIAGELQGKIRTGVALNASRTRTANMWLALLNKFGLPAERYASSTGALSL